MAKNSGFKNPIRENEQSGRYVKLVSKAVEETSTLETIDWMFLTVLASNHCKNETFSSLQYEYSLPDFLKLKEYVEIMDAYELARHKDFEIKEKLRKKK